MASMTSETATAGAPILMASEAERYAEGLRRFTLREVGSPAYIKQHEVVSKLNLQAHHSVAVKGDNFVTDSLVTFEQVQTLIHELLLAEAWHEKVYPLINKHAVKMPQGGLRLYFVMYHESALINLLEVMMYYEYVAEAAEDAILELIDYCARKIVYLAQTGSPKINSWMKGKTAKEIAKEIESTDPLLDSLQQSEQIRFQTAVVACVIARLLTGHLPKLPLSAMTRVLDTHDLIMAILPLIENPPWVRRNADKEWEKYIGHKWKVVAPSELMTVTTTEGQAWLLLYNLICSGEVRKHYHFNSFRKDQLLRVRKYINEILVDQLPVLADVQRFMDELTIMEAPAPTESRRFIVEQAPVIRDSIVRNTDWKAEAAWIASKVFCDQDNKDLKELAGLYTDDGVAAMLEEESKPSIAKLLRVKRVDLAIIPRSESTDESGEQSKPIIFRYEPKKEGDLGAETSTKSGLFRRIALKCVAYGQPPNVLALEEADSSPITKSKKFIDAATIFDLTCDVIYAVDKLEVNGATSEDVKPAADLHVILSSGNFSPKYVGAYPEISILCRDQAN